MSRGCHSTGIRLPRGRVWFCACRPGLNRLPGGGQHGKGIYHSPRRARRHPGHRCRPVDRVVSRHPGAHADGALAYGESGAMAFMRFNDDHHNIVLFTHPTAVTEENRNAGYNALQHIALEVADRDEWLKALADMRRKGVKIVQGPLNPWA